MADAFQYDVSLNHSAKDKAVVRPLAERLRKDGLKLAKFVIRHSSFGIAKPCMSAHAFGSDWGAQFFSMSLTNRRMALSIPLWPPRFLTRLPPMP
jgi:hypothetical protein